MILGDFSPCLEHLLHAYYIVKTGKDSGSYLQECETNGLQSTFGKFNVRTHLQIATTRRKVSQLTADEVRTDEYKTRFADVDLILLCFYQNNNKTLVNIRSKYIKELQSWYPKVPLYLLGLTINEIKDGYEQPMRETINVEDRWLKRDLEVSSKESKRLAKEIKAKGLLQCAFRAREELSDEKMFVDEETIENYRSVEKALDKAIKFAMKKTHRTCMVLFR